MDLAAPGRRRSGRARDQADPLPHRHHSPIVDALVDAAQAGKDVTVIIELRARFDEEANIELSNRLQEAGAHVMYGVVGYKTHAKLTLIVRREAEGIRRYCHLGTGNYHPGTARATPTTACSPAMRTSGSDVHEIFLQLTSLTRTPKLRAPAAVAVHAARVDPGNDRARDRARARRASPARIIAKLNALVDPQTIETLYRASRAGVKIDLIVRGVCALRPGIPGVSENIRVRSIVGRFLEHSRVFWFENGGEAELYCASADWMERNFFRRVEVAFPVLRKPPHERDPARPRPVLGRQHAAWRLQADGTYERIARGEARALSVQAELLATYAAGPATVS